MSSLTPERLNELEQIAKAATPGQWAQMPNFPLLVVPIADVAKHVGGATDPAVDATYASPIAKVEEYTPDYEGWERFTRRRFNRQQNKADAAHIAAFNPATVLALLSEVRALRESVGRLEQERATIVTAYRALLQAEWDTWQAIMVPSGRTGREEQALRKALAALTPSASAKEPTP